MSETYTFPFTATHTFPADGAAPGQVAFHLGEVTPYTFCITTSSLRTSAEPPPPYEPDTGPRVRVNQVGYLPRGPSSATLVTDGHRPPDVGAARAAGTSVATGRTVPRGVDPTPGRTCTTSTSAASRDAGHGYTLEADGEASHPFDIGADLYEQLRSDALNYFYLTAQRHRRSTATSSATGVRPRRRATSGVAPEPGRHRRALLGPRRRLYGDWTCDYTLDVTRRLVRRGRPRQVRGQRRHLGRRSC